MAASISAISQGFRNGLGLFLEQQPKYGSGTEATAKYQNSCPSLLRGRVSPKNTTSKSSRQK